jgi:hypothetical protein
MYLPLIYFMYDGMNSIKISRASQVYVIRKCNNFKHKASKYNSHIYFNKMFVFNSKYKLSVLLSV